MRGKILGGIVIVAALYGALFLVERMMTQELTRGTNPAMQESVCLMWMPSLLKGDGLCAVELRNAQGKVLDTVALGRVDNALTALMQYGQMTFAGKVVTVENLKTGELARRWVVREGRLEKEK